jgi:hypothetical protein
VTRKKPNNTYTFGVRVQYRLARRIRGIAAVDGTTAADLTRDMLEAIFGGDQGKLIEFLTRIQSAIQRHADKAVTVPGPDGGLWTAPNAKSRRNPPAP